MMVLSSKAEHLDRPYLNLTIELAYFNEDRELRFFNASGGVMDNDADNAYGNLRITASHDLALTREESYGWRVEYRDLYSVNQRRAEAMVKTLRKIEKGLERLEAKWGSPDTWAAYVIRVGDVLGVKVYGHQQSTEARSMTGEMYRWGDANTLRWQVTDRIAKFDNQYGPAEVAS